MTDTSHIARQQAIWRDQKALSRERQRERGDLPPRKYPIAVREEHRKIQRLLRETAERRPERILEALQEVIPHLQIIRANVRNGTEDAALVEGWIETVKVLQRRIGKR